MRTKSEKIAIKESKETKMENSPKKGKQAKKKLC
jgi:hypothetical protein